MNRIIPPATIILVMLFSINTLVGMPVFAEICDPNAPSYSQPGCVEGGQQSPLYTPPVSTIPYTPSTSTTPYQVPLKSPLFEKLDGEDGRNGDVTESEIDSEELLDTIQSTLDDITAIHTLLDKQTQSLIYFSIDSKKVKSKLAAVRSQFNTIKKSLDDEDDEKVEKSLEEVDMFVSATFIEALGSVQQAYDVVRRLPNAKVRTLLRNAFKPIAASIMHADSSTAHEALSLYLHDTKKNKKLYESKKLSSRSTKKLNESIKALNKKLSPGEKNTSDQKTQEPEVKKSSGVDTKRISDDTKKLNDAFQRSNQNDAQNRVWNLYQNIGY
ncbi:MAG: hypothetical protein AAB400_01815 [Patescibacteria group bacterium]